MKKLSLMKSKSYVTYVKMCFVLMKMRNYIIKSETIVITPENLAELLIASEI